MTTEQIKILFNEAIQERGVSEKLEGISKDNIYDWKKERVKPPTIGDMLNVLFQLKKIIITPNYDHVFSGLAKTEFIEDRNGNRIEVPAFPQRTNSNK